MKDEHKIVIKIALMIVAHLFLTCVLIALVIFIAKQITDGIKEGGGLKQGFEELWHGEQQKESEAE